VEIVQLWSVDPRIDLDSVELENIISMIKDSAEADRNYIRQLQSRVGDMI